MPGVISMKPPAQPTGAIRDYLPGQYNQGPGWDLERGPMMPQVPMAPVQPPQDGMYQPSPWRDMQGQPMTPQGWGAGQTYYMGNVPWIPQPARTGFGQQPMSNLGSLMGSSYRPQIALRR